MEKTYAETFALRTCHCDMYGEWRPGAILESMQETAGAHCARLGIGRDVTDALGIAWVLSRSHVALERVPRIGQTVTVETWPLPSKHLFFPRANAFRDAEGRQIGAATSLWVLLDVASRRIVSSEEVLAHLPDNRDLPGGMPGNVRALAGEAETGAFAPAYSDFDVNGHVNNTRYLDWTCAALGFETMAAARVKAFSVSYDREILPGEEVQTELVRADGGFSFCGAVGGRRCFTVAGAMESRE